MLALNVGNADRLIRTVVGVGLIGLAATGKVGPWGYIGILPLLTGAVAWCPLYRIFGISTTSR